MVITRIGINSRLKKPWRRAWKQPGLRRLPSARSVAIKKTPIASEQDRPDVVEQRAAWRASQESIDPDKVVFIDDTWAEINMTRTYGRSPRGWWRSSFEKAPMR